jgi:hypothetical protein
MYICIILEQQFHISLFVYYVIFSTSSKFLLATIIIVDLVDNNAVFLSGSESMQVFHSLLIFVLPLEIQLLKR